MVPCEFLSEKYPFFVFHHRRRQVLPITELIAQFYYFQHRFDFLVKIVFVLTNFDNILSFFNEACVVEHKFQGEQVSFFDAHDFVAENVSHLFCVVDDPQVLLTGDADKPDEAPDRKHFEVWVGYLGKLLLCHQQRLQIVLVRQVQIDDQILLVAPRVLDLDVVQSQEHFLPAWFVSNVYAYRHYPVRVSVFYFFILNVIQVVVQF